MANTTKSPLPEDSPLYGELLELSNQSRQTTCTIGLFYRDLDQADQVGLQAALDSPAIKGTAIAEVLKRRGVQVSSHTVQRHRRGDCGCGRNG